MSQAGPAVQRVVADDGVTLAYTARGSGPTGVMLMHGWASTKTYYDEVTSLMAGDVRLVSVDLRGHGDSDAVTDGHTVERYARDLLLVADAAGVENFVTVGHSMGGKFIQFVPLLAPQRVLGQVLLGGTPAGAVPLEKQARDEWVGYAGSEDAMLTSLHSNTTASVSPSVAHKWARQACRVPKQVLDVTLQLCFGYAFAERIAELPSLPPTLAVAGAHDPFFTTGFLRDRLLTEIRGCRFWVLDCGHEIPLELPSETAGLLESFLAGCGVGGS